MAYPAFRTGAVSRVARASATSVSITRPPGTVTGDVTLAFLELHSTATPSGASWTSAGFIEQPGSTTPIRLYCFWRRDDGNAGPFTLSWTGAATSAVSAVSYTNVISSVTPIAAISAPQTGGPVPTVIWSATIPLNQQSAGTFTIPTQHILDGRMMVAWYFQSGGFSVTPPAGETWTSPAGWDVDVAPRRVQAFHKRIRPAETVTKTWTFAGLIDGVLGMAVLNGVDATTPFGTGIPLSGGGAAAKIGIDFPAVTATEPNTAVLYFGGKNNGFTYTSTDFTIFAQASSVATNEFGRSTVAGILTSAATGTVPAKFANETSGVLDEYSSISIPVNPSDISSTPATVATAHGFTTSAVEQLLVYAATSLDGVAITSPTNFTTRAASGAAGQPVVVGDYTQPSPGATGELSGTLGSNSWTAAMLVDLIPAVPVAAPDAPTGLTVTLVSGAPQVSWTSVTTATGYHVYRDSIKQTTSPVTTTSWIDSSTVTPGNHTYQVSGVNAGGEGLLSSPYTFNMPDPNPPGGGGGTPPPTPDIIGSDKLRAWITGLTNGNAIQVRAVGVLDDGTRTAASNPITLTPQVNTAVATESYRNALLSLPNINAYLPLGDTAGSSQATDVSGNSANGSYNGAPVQGGARLVISDPTASTSMDGLDDFISLGDRFDYANRTPFFVSVVFQPATIKTTFQQLVQKVGNDTAARTQGWEFGFSSANGINAARILDSASDRALGGTLIAGTTYRVMMVYDGASILIYVNGVLTGSIASVSSIRDSAASLLVGTGLQGLMGHIAIGQSAPTQAQINTIEQTARHGDDVAPLTPSGVTATALSTGVQLSWTPSTSIDHRRTIVEQNIGGTWSRVAVTSLNTITLATNTSTQQFRVYDQDTFGNTSSASAIVSATPTTTDPAPPAVTGARSFNGDASVTLDWDDSTFPNFSNYRVYRQASDGTWPTSPVFTPTASQQAVTGLTNGVTYRFRVSQVSLTAVEGPVVEIVAQPQAPVTGVGGAVITNGQLRQTSTSKKLILPKSAQLYENSDNTIKHGDTATLSTTDFIGIAVKVPIDRSKMLLGYVASDRLYLASRVGTTQTVIDSKPLSALMLPGQSYWLQVFMSSNTIALGHFLTDPQLGGTQQDFLNRALTGADATNFGAGVTGQVGIYLATTTGFATRWIDDFRTSSLAGPGTNAVANNLGNFPSEPLIELIGPMTTPEVVNLRNSQIMRFTGSILQGERFFIDVASKRITDGDGASRMNQLDLASDWIELEPGSNQLRVSTATPGLTTAMNVSWRHSWL